MTSKPEVIQVLGKSGIGNLPPRANVSEKPVSDAAARDPQEKARAAPHTAPEVHRELLQLAVFGLGLLQDGDVGVGVFPAREEVLILSFCFAAVAFHRIGAAQI